MSMDEDLRELIGEIHEKKIGAVLELAGAGTKALSWLHDIPGSSGTILEAHDRYSRESLDDLSDRPFKKYADTEVAEFLALKAHCRAIELGGSVGIGCAAALTTNRKRRGDNVAYVSIHAPACRVRIWINIKKDFRTRREEEAVVARLIIYSLCKYIWQDNQEKWPRWYGPETLNHW